MDVQRAILEGFATFFGGAVATVLFLLPGYVIGKAYSGGIRSPTPSDRAFLTTIASGGLLVHLIALPWTAPLAQYVIEKLPDLDLAHLPRSPRLVRSRSGDPPRCDWSGRSPDR